MYRILITRGNKAYAIECDSEFEEYSKYYDNLFDENINYFMEGNDVVILMNDLDDFEEYFPDYELQVVNKEE